VQSLLNTRYGVVQFVQYISITHQCNVCTRYILAFKYCNETATDIYYVVLYKFTTKIISSYRIAEK